MVGPNPELPAFPRHAPGCAGVPVLLVPVTLIVFAVAVAWAVSMGGSSLGWLLLPLCLGPALIYYGRWVHGHVGRVGAVLR